MVVVLPTGPYTTPLNWRLCATNLGETYIPFALYVQPDTSRKQCTTFVGFSKLPLELRLYIISLCDSATLFQLMHTSASLRPEAAKLFWSYSKAWYHVDGHWLLAGGSPGNAHYARDFLAYLQQIEVNIEHADYLEEEWDDGVCRGRLVDPRRLQERRRNFWEVLRFQFPCARRVVLSESVLRRPSSALPDSLKKMVQACPDSISASASVLRMQTKYSRQVVRYRAQPTLPKNAPPSRWEVEDQEWTQQSILIPPKVWRGPVGEYAKIDYLFTRYMFMQHARSILLIVAIERCHFYTQQVPFNCPHSACDAHFERAGQWPLHAVETGHCIQAKVPPTYEEAFDKHSRMLARMEQEELHGAVQKMREAGSRLESEERKKVQQEFLYQLENDPCYRPDKPARECLQWKRYMESIWGVAYAEIEASD